MTKVKPYTKLAEIYDALMNHVDYDKWASYLEELLKYADIRVNTILDLSCGTGTLLLHMKDGRYHYFGCDLSKAMLKKAAYKLEYFPIPLFINDACNIALQDQTFDAIIFLYDSINYILQKDNLLRFLKDVRRILRPGGILIFDTVSEYHCKTYYHDTHESEHWGKNGYYRHSLYDEENKIQRTNFKVKIGNRYYLEKHQQRIYSTNELVSLLQINNFELVGIFQNFTFNRMQLDAERVHYVCKKSILSK
jgi:SAM-dependent methyltransferase